MWYVCEFYSRHSLSLFCLRKFIIYISCAGVILPLRLYYICVCINMFVNSISMFAAICLCMVYNIIIRCTAYSVSSPLYIVCVVYSNTAMLLHICSNSYVCEVISLFTAICFCTLHHLLLGSTPYWRSLLHIFPGLTLHCCHPHLPVSLMVD